MLKATLNMRKCLWKSPPRVLWTKNWNRRNQVAQNRVPSSARSRRSLPLRSCCQLRTRVWSSTRTGGTSACRPCTCTRRGRGSGESCKPTCSSFHRCKILLFILHLQCVEAIISRHDSIKPLKTFTQNSKVIIDI